MLCWFWEGCLKRNSAERSLYWSCSGKSWKLGGCWEDVFVTKQRLVGVMSFGLISGTTGSFSLSSDSSSLEEEDSRSKITSYSTTFSRGPWYEKLVVTMIQKFENNWLTFWFSVVLIPSFAATSNPIDVSLAFLGLLDKTSLDSFQDLILSKNFHFLLKMFLSFLPFFTLFFLY